MTGMSRAAIRRESILGESLPPDSSECVLRPGLAAMRILGVRTGHEEC
jgi:hypothetical protein